jgi:hypothetical protein
VNNLPKLKLPVAFLWVLLALAIDEIGAEAQSKSVETNSAAGLESRIYQSRSRIWQNDVGQGFLPTTELLSVEAGAAPGIATFGSQQAHDFALMSLTYGHVLGHVLGEGHWYRGNFEGRLELWGGGQYSPSSELVIGLTPHLRYDFATGTRLVPFLDGGAGVTATSIGPPDLSGTFEFNLQANVGAHWFLRDHLALSGEAGYMHMSCAGIHHPNLGANNVCFMVGVTWFFGT